MLLCLIIKHKSYFTLSLATTHYSGSDKMISLVYTKSAHHENSCRHPRQSQQFDQKYYSIHSLQIQVDQMKLCRFAPPPAKKKSCQLEPFALTDYWSVKQDNAGIHPIKFINQGHTIKWTIKR